MILFSVFPHHYCFSHAYLSQRIFLQMKIDVYDSQGFSSTFLMADRSGRLKGKATLCQLQWKGEWIAVKVQWICTVWALCAHFLLSCGKSQQKSPKRENECSLWQSHMEVSLICGCFVENLSCVVTTGSLHLS